MSDENTPEQPAPAPQQPSPAPPAPPAQTSGGLPSPGSPAQPAPSQGGSRPGNFQGRPPRPGGPRPGGTNRPFPKGERAPNPGGAPPSLDRRDFAALKPNSRELDKQIEDELNQAMAGFDLKETVTPPEPQARPAGGARAGSRKKGRVVGFHGKDVFVEVPGGRSQGVLPIQQFEGQPPKLGDEVDFEIERYDAGDGLLILTREGSTQVVTDWSRVAYGMIVEAKVTGTNKNKTGLTVEVNGIKGFLPASQLDLYRVADIEQFVNQRLKVMVAEVVPEERNLIVSRRAILERERQVKAEQFWATVTEGQIKKGIVRSVKPFGVFVDLGGADGLLPVSEISWQRVNDPNELFKVGDSVEVKINRLDTETRKISLSLRALTTSPWDEFAKETKAGARITGKVTRLADFGAFVELQPGVEGLIHVSELSTQRTRRVRDVVSEGQSVEVEVLSVDAEARRIGLSLKSIMRAKEAGEDAAEQAEREGDAKAAEEMLASRPLNPNLRGGIGGTPVKFDAE